MQQLRVRKSVLTITLVGLFAALSFVALFIKVPIAEQFLHVGNAICILAALLLGGWQGGLAGSIGMGMYDLFWYPDSLIKTLILKFGIGLFTGLIAHGGKREKRSNPRIWLTVATVLCFGAGGLLLANYTADPEKMGKSLVACGFLLVLGASLAVLLVLSFLLKQLSDNVLYAALGATAGIAWNVVGEFVWKTVQGLLLGMTMDAAIAATLVKIPATFINGSFSVILAVLLYIPLRAALKKARLDTLLA